MKRTICVLFSWAKKSTESTESTEILIFLTFLEYYRKLLTKRAFNSTILGAVGVPPPYSFNNQGIC